MTTWKSFNRAASSALLTVVILAGCGGETPESMLSSAKAFMAKNDNKAALIQLKNALQKNPNLGEARFLMGKALLDGGEPTSADVDGAGLSDVGQDRGEQGRL